MSKAALGLQRKNRPGIVNRIYIGFMYLLMFTCSTLMIASIFLIKNWELAGLSLGTWLGSLALIVIYERNINKE